MTSTARSNRRTFLTRTGQTAAVLAVSGAAAIASTETNPVIRIAGEQVRGIASDSRGRIAVAVDHEVQLFDASGQFVKKHDVGAAVRAVAFSADGSLVFALKERVGRITSSIVEVLPVALGRAAVIADIAIASDGRIYCADSGQRVVWRLNGMGEIVGQIRPSNQGFLVSKAFFPIECRNDRLIVAEPGRHRIYNYDLSGRLLSHWGVRSRSASGFAGCCNPVGIATTDDGRLITAERGSIRIKAFQLDGKYVGELAGPDAFAKQFVVEGGDFDALSGCLHGGLDIAVGPDNRIMVLDRSAKEIRVLS